MLTIHVSFKIKEEYIEAFKVASLENARHSIEECGVINFQVLQQSDDNSKFLFIEVFKTQEAQAKHRETSHFKKWRKAIDEMLLEPYAFKRYENLTKGL